MTDAQKQVDAFVRICTDGSLLHWWRIVPYGSSGAKHRCVPATLHSAWGMHWFPSNVSGCRDFGIGQSQMNATLGTLLGEHCPASDRKDLRLCDPCCAAFARSLDV